jgi:hypothetical protein
MPDCKYCDRSFAGEDDYHEHLAEEHADELSRIDRRRVDGVSTEDEGFPTGPVILIGVVGFALLLVAYVLLFLGNGGGGSGTVNGIAVQQMPTNVGGSDFHGRINVTINGTELDFSRNQFQRQDPAFHFEGGRGDIWHGHADGLTLEYAMATLGIEVSEDSVTYDGTTYNDSDSGTTVEVLVDGEPVDPTEHTLSGTRGVSDAQNGDFIEIHVRTDGN